MTNVCVTGGVLAALLVVAGCDRRAAEEPSRMRVAATGFPLDARICIDSAVDTFAKSARPGEALEASFDAEARTLAPGDVERSDGHGETRVFTNFSPEACDTGRDVSLKARLSLEPRSNSYELLVSRTDGHGVRTAKSSRRQVIAAALKSHRIFRDGVCDRNDCSTPPPVSYEEAVTAMLPDDVHAAMQQLFPEGPPQSGG